MFVTTLRVSGLRDAPEWEGADLQRVVELPPGPPGIAIADALDLFAGSLDAVALRLALERLGLARGGEILEEGGLPVQADITDPGAVAAWVDVERTRNVTVQVELEPDPPLFGRLRELALRDPRLVTALGQSPTIRVKAGWLLSRDRSVAAIGLSELAVGEVAFPATGAERPAWLLQILQDVGGRFRRVDWREGEAALSARLRDAALSADPDRRRAYRAAVEALAGEPFGLGALELVQDAPAEAAPPGTPAGVHACFGSSLRRTRQFGPAAVEALRLVEAVHLAGPDVLVVEAPGSLQRDPAAVRAWLAAATESSLEQVFLVPGGGR